jgi:hypothetical protein
MAKPALFGCSDFSAKRLSRLALRELEAAAGFGAAVFFALDDTRIAGEETAALEHRTQVRLIAQQRFGKTMAYGARLTGQAAAGYGAHNVVLTLTI